MNKNSEYEQLDVYIIPPNFIDSGTLFGGAFKLRNAIEAAVLMLLTGLPTIGAYMSWTAKIILLCFTALPLGIFALTGIDGVSLSGFVLRFVRFLLNRRVLLGAELREQQANQAPDTVKKKLPQLLKRNRDNSVENFLPISKIQSGIVYTSDRRHLKILELEPINFSLRSAREQRGIIYSFVSYLKVSPIKLQFKVCATR
jgi:hypothetical protein